MISNIRINKIIIFFEALKCKGEVVHKNNVKIAIIGAGSVGSTAAFALMLDGSVSEIALIDINKDKAEGEVLDLNHCMQFTRMTHIVGGDSFALVEGAAVVVITAGIAQKPGEKRTDLLAHNAKLLSKIIPEITRYNKSCILLMVTNPLDVMTYLAYKISGFDACKVFGSGTVLDSARLRYLIGKHYQISPKDITAFVLGEHGDSEFAWWSKANIAGSSLSAFMHYDQKMLNTFFEETKNAAYQVIEKKGSTCYAIALVIVKIIRSIVLNQPRIFTVSSLVHNIQGINDVCLSLPTIIRDNGVCEILPIDFNQEEKKLLQRSAEKIHQDIQNALLFVG